MNLTQYKSTGLSTAQTDASQSNLWADCPVLEIKHGILRGWYQEDDFTDLVISGTQTSILDNVGGKYRLLCPASGSWSVVNAIPSTEYPGGFLRVLCDTDGDHAAFGYTAMPFCLNTAVAGRMWGEARIAMTGIAANNAQVFVGLAETSVTNFTTAIPLGNADIANSSMAMIGFNVLEDGLGAVNGCYQDRSTTWVNPTGGTGIGQMAANTFIKLGWTFNPSTPTEAFTWYVNGVKKSSISLATLQALTNLDVKPLSLCIAQYADSAGTANYLYMDWWKCYQLAP